MVMVMVVIGKSFAFADHGDDNTLVISEVVRVTTMEKIMVIMASRPGGQW